jgi:hypothetical protein
MEASSRWLLGEMPKDGAAGALRDRRLRPHRESRRSFPSTECPDRPWAVPAALPGLSSRALDRPHPHRRLLSPCHSDLSEEDQANLARRASIPGVLNKVPSTVIGTTRFSRCAVASRMDRTAPSTACRFETITIERKSLVIEAGEVWSRLDHGVWPSPTFDIDLATSRR